MLLHQAKVCLLGNFAVGKTSLVRRFVEDRFDDRYLSTIGVKISRKILDRSWGRLKLLVWDLAGEEKFIQYLAVNAGDRVMIQESSGNWFRILYPVEGEPVLEGWVWNSLVTIED